MVRICSRQGHNEAKQSFASFFFIMASFYILFSKTIDKFYIGSCKDLEIRILQHNTNYFINSFTSKTNDWVLVLQIDELTQFEARKIELHVKKMKSKVYITNLIQYPEMKQKLKEKFKTGSSR